MFFMQSTKQVQLSETEYRLAASVLHTVANLSDEKLAVAYSHARQLLESVSYESSFAAVSVWCTLTHCDLNDLLLIALSKEISQIVSKIDSDDSIIDFFGWLLVGKLHGVDIKKLLDLLDYRIFTNKSIWA